MVAWGIAAPPESVTRPVKTAVGPASADTAKATAVSALRMIRVRIQIRVKQSLTVWFIASAEGLNRYEDRVNLREHLGVIEFQYPAILFLIVDVEHAQSLNRFRLRFAAAPGLEAGVDHRLTVAIEVERVENQGFAFGVEHPAECRTVFALPIDVKDVHDVQISRAHQIANVAVRGEQLAFALQRG